MDHSFYIFYLNPKSKTWLSICLVNYHKNLKQLPKTKNLFTLLFTWPHTDRLIGHIKYYNGIPTQNYHLTSGHKYFFHQISKDLTCKYDLYLCLDVLLSESQKMCFALNLLTHVYFPFKKFKVQKVELFLLSDIATIRSRTNNSYFLYESFWMHAVWPRIFRAWKGMKVYVLLLPISILLCLSTTS